MQRQAWYNWLASMNRPSFGFEYKYRAFDELFMPPRKAEQMEEGEFADLVEACKTMGIEPPKRF